jgi:hypothetical protein
LDVFPVGFAISAAAAPVRAQHAPVRAQRAAAVAPSTRRLALTDLGREWAAKLRAEQIGQLSPKRQAGVGRRRSDSPDTDSLCMRCGGHYNRRPFGWIVNLAYAQICLPVVFLFHPPKRAWV